MADERKTTEELVALIDQCPSRYSRWRHKATGKKYIVSRRAILEATCEPAVVYCDEILFWVRPLAEFLEKFEPID